MNWAPDALARDVRFGVRMLRKQPGFTLAITFSLALGVGASTALFTLVRNVLFRSLAVPDPNRIVLVYNSYPKAGIPHVGAAGADYVDRLREVTSFEEQSLFTAVNPSLEIDGAPERVHAMEATASFFRLIRVAPRVGRTFRVEEERAGSNRVVVLSAGLADRLFGASDAAAGRSVQVNGEPYLVVGVMPRGFIFIDTAVQLWLPLTLTDRDKEHTHANNWTYIGRLKAGRTINQAQAEIDAINAANLDRFPETRQLVIDAGFRSIAVPLQDDLVRDVRPTLQYLWGGALFVLLIGVLNVASLAQARAHARTRELSTRLALGAGLPRLVRQLVVEHLVLTLAAAGAGVLLAAAGLRAMDTLPLGHLPPAAARQIDMVIVGYAMATALLLGAILGAVPALTLLGGGAATLRLETRAATSARGSLLRRLLVVLQVSVAFVLLIAAGLMLASFRRAAGVDLGFATDRILTASVTLPATRYGDAAAVRAFAEAALASIRVRPGVLSAGVTSSIPLGDDYGMQMILPEGYRPEPGQSFVGSYRNAVSSSFFETMGATLVAGRFFDRRDDADGPRTVIVDSRLARRFWRGENPVGRRMFFPERRNPFTTTARTPPLAVVGVVKDLRMRGAADATATIGAYFVPFAQDPARSLTFAIRTAVSPSSLFDGVRAAIRAHDQALPIFDVRSMEEREQIALAPRRLPAAVASAFAAVALGLSTVGIYGVLAFVLAQRRREIGIRIALGSSRRQVFTLIAREGALLVAIGLAAGLAGAWLAGRGVERYLFVVRADDPGVFGLALALLGAAAAIACLLPALRATRIDPVTVLAE